MFHQTACICEMLSYQIFVNVIVPSGAARRSRAARRSPPPIALTAPLRHRARSARFAQDCPSPPPRDLSQTRRCPMLGPSAAAAHLRRREAARGVRRARARARCARAIPPKWRSLLQECPVAVAARPQRRAALRRPRSRDPSHMALSHPGEPSAAVARPFSSMARRAERPGFAASRPRRRAAPAAFARPRLIPVVSGGSPRRIVPPLRRRALGVAPSGRRPGPAATRHSPRPRALAELAPPPSIS